MKHNPYLEFAHIKDYIPSKFGFSYDAMFED